MCDYSLGGLPNRLAVEGEELVVHRFPTHSIGLASSADLETVAASVRNRSTWGRIKDFFTLSLDSADAPAVCVPPGASLILKNVPSDLQGKWCIREEESVLFVQTSSEVDTYRDAFCFSNGKQVLLQELTEGLPVKVVSLGGDLTGEPEPALALRRHSPAR